MANWTYFHTLDPFIIHFVGSLGIRWYSMAYIMGFVVAYWIITNWLIKKNLIAFTKTDISDLIVWIAMGVILGGRIGYVLFYSPNILTEFDSQFPYWELLKIYHGGLASHGGIIGLIVAAYLFAKSRGCSFYRCLDLAVLGFLGIGFGRIANFINGELFGRIIHKKVLLAVQFPQEMLLWISQNKINRLQDLSEAVSYLKINAHTWREWLFQFQSGESSARIYSTVYSLIEACENGNQQIISSLKEVISYRYPSQLYQAVLEGFIPFLVICFLWSKPSIKPGWIAGVAALLYAVMRILGEQFRMPDAHIGFQALGMTRGQWLSVFMVIGVLFYFILCLKNSKHGSRNTPPQ